VNDLKKSLCKNKAAIANVKCKTQTKITKQDDKNWFLW